MEFVYTKYPSATQTVEKLLTYEKNQYFALSRRHQVSSRTLHFPLSPDTPRKTHHTH